MRPASPGLRGAPRQGLCATQDRSALAFIGIHDFQSNGIQSRHEGKELHVQAIPSIMTGGRRHDTLVKRGASRVREQEIDMTTRQWFFVIALVAGAIVFVGSTLFQWLSPTQRALKWAKRGDSDRAIDRLNSDGYSDYCPTGRPRSVSRHSRRPGASNGGSRRNKKAISSLAAATRLEQLDG